MDRRRLPDEAPPRILIARLSAIGDAILTLPVLCALRQRIPDAFLAWVAEERAASLIEGHEALDELIVLPRGWLKSLKTIRRLRQRLRVLRLDVAIDPQSLTKSALVARMSGAKRRIGFGDEKGRELSRWLNNELVSTSASHVVDCNLALLGPLGIDFVAAEFGVPEKAEDAAAARELIRQSGLEDGFAVINPGAGWRSRIWPPDRHAAVARHLGDAHRLPSLVVWAGQEERAMAETIAAGSGGHGRLAPSTTLRQLGALLRRARVCVTPDTGPLHLAAAVGTPCVSLHGPTWAERSGPYGSQHVALQGAKLDDPLHRNRKTASRELIEAITVDMVRQACDTVLSWRDSAAA